MSRRSNRKKRIALDRATPVYLSGNGGLMYVAPGQAQSTQGQVFYGGSTKNVATGQTALFSPGVPLQPQQNANPSGYPITYRFPVAWNTFPVDRTSQNPDIPSFQQLRNLAKLYSGVGICERGWMDLVPRMQLKIGLKPEYIAAGADEKDYQPEISYFQSWFESPDKMHDLHSWIRMALREQSQIDELYIYKRKKRGGGLYSMEIISGDQIKPLLDDWGKIPQPPSFAYQQYPWGIPGAWFRADEMIHYQESPAADNPYGQSRVERIIMLVNQALRKQKKDLSHFTEGNIPQGMMLVPDNATWTPDQIDAFEQAWNALLAGNATQQVRMRFTQPGMKYQAFEQYALDPTFDKFLLNIAVSVYGMSMQDVAFTEDIHKSSGDSQQNVLYRRTIDPLAVIYASFITQSINTDFDPDLHGEMFQASFTAFDEEEDVSELAGAYSTLVTSGILGITNAGKILKLPDDPNAPYIGRVIVTKDGPIFLDDMASDKMRNAQMQAQLAGYQQVPKSPQQPGGDTENDETGQPEKENQSEESKSGSTPEKEPTPPSTSTPQEASPQKGEASSAQSVDQQEEEETQTPEDAEREDDITSLLKSDESEPFTPLERHVPGGHDHDQKTHGDGAHPAYGAKHDKTPANKAAMAAEAKAAPKLTASVAKVQAAEAKVKSAQSALHTASPDEKAQARANLKQAHADLHQARLEASAQKKQATAAAKEVKAEAKEEKQEQAAKVKEERADGSEQAQKLAAQKKTAAAQLKAAKLKAHLQKQQAAANAKAAKMVVAAQHKAQLAAAKAALAQVTGQKAQAKMSSAAAHAALKAAKAQQKAAKVVQSLANTIGSKATLYNALSARKISKSWSAQDSHDASSIADDLHSLLTAVNSHADESNATGLLNNLKQSISALQGQKGITAARGSVLEKLASRIQQQMAFERAVGSADDDEEIDLDLDGLEDNDEYWFDEEDGDDEWEQDEAVSSDDDEYIAEEELIDEITEEPESEAEQRYTISELLQLLSQQMQAATASQDAPPHLERSRKGSEVGGATEHAGSEKETTVALAEQTDGDVANEREIVLELNRWRGRAITDVKQHRAFRGFTTLVIPEHIHESISEQLEECSTIEGVKTIFQRAKSTSSSVTLFLDIDGVLTITRPDAPIELINNINAQPIPLANALLQAIDRATSIRPVWLTHWGDDALGWNTRAQTKPWDVAYPLSRQEVALAHQLFPSLHDKPLAIQYYLHLHAATQSAVWIQDGFPGDVQHSQNYGYVRLIDTTQDPTHSLLLSDQGDAVSMLMAEIAVNAPNNGGEAGMQTKEGQTEDTEGQQ